MCVCAQVIDASGGVSWDDIAGLETAKHLIKEIVVWPMLNPHLFTVSDIGGCRLVQPLVLMTCWRPTHATACKSLPCGTCCISLRLAFTCSVSGRQALCTDLRVTADGGGRYMSVLRVSLLL